MPKWIHDRADHLREKNPEMPKAQSFAIATQQSYASDKAPKKYGTPQGRHEAKKKYDDPKSHYKKTAGIPLGTLLGFSEELRKIASPSTGLIAVPKPKATRPGAWSKAQKPEHPGPAVDFLSSSKTNPPPPMTAGGF